MVQWACAKVRVAREDAEMVRDEIVKRVGHLPGVSFAEIAATAWRAGRVELATRLLDHEARAAEQVSVHRINRNIVECVRESKIQ
jgi:predicted nucleic acid-binding protein